jgi:hypothetical protein
MHVSGEDGVLRRRLDEFLAKREPPKTFCPSEVARALSADELKECGYEGWKDAMDDVRKLAWDLRESGECEVVQKGDVVEAGALEDVRGPIRIRRIDKGV